MTKKRAVYVSTSCVRGQHDSLEALVRDYLAAGIHHIELGVGPAPTSQRLDEFLRSTGGQFAIHNYFPPPADPFVLNLASASGTIRRQSIELASRAIRLCAAIGGEFYSVHSGFRADFSIEALGGTLERKTIESYEASYERYVDAIRSVAREARTEGVRLLVEPNVLERRNLVDGKNQLLLMVTASELRRFFADVADSGVGLLLDTGHLNVSAGTLGFDRQLYVDDVAPFIRAFHLHDNDGTADRHQPVTAGSWPHRVLTDARFLNLPVVVESRFESVAEAAAHADGLFSIEAARVED